MAIAQFKATSNIVDTPEQSPLGNVYFCIGLVDPLSSNAIEFSNRYVIDITKFDLTSTGYPIPVSSLLDLNPYKVQVVEMGRYDNEANEITSQTIPCVRKVRQLGQNVPPVNNELAHVQVGDVYYFDDFELSANLAGYAIVVLNDHDAYPLINYDFYIKYKLIYENGQESGVGKFVFYRGVKKEIKVNFNSVAIHPIEAGQINTLNIRDFEGLNFEKDFLNSDVNTTISTASPLLPMIIPNVYENGKTIMYKIQFTDEYYIAPLTTDPVIIDERLTYCGKPVVYGQVITREAMDAGLLKYDAIGLSENEINNKKLYLILHGYLTGYGWR